jgi:peptidoglycan-associated lipoprotein
MPSRTSPWNTFQSKKGERVTRRFRTAAIVSLIIIVPLGLVSCGGKKTVRSDYQAMPALPKESGESSRSSLPTPSGSADWQALEDVRFDYDRYNLRPDAKEIIARHAKVLLEHPDLSVRIEGHCDERGTVEYNLALGERRAQAVLDYLVAYGILRDRISVVTYGEERPLDSGHDETAWARNRRAAFVTSTRS